MIGWHTITIEEQSVGKKLAVFTAIEVKKPGGRKQEAQEHFIDTVQEAGGLAFFATSPEEAVGKMWGGK